MSNGVSMTLDDLIEAALTGKNYNQRRLGDESRRFALALVKRKAFELPDDVKEDIAQEAFVALYEAGPSALKRHGGGEKLFRACVLVAIRRVRSDYVQPGQRTRLPKAPKTPAERDAEVAAASRIPRATAPATPTEDLQPVEDVLDATRILEAAPPGIVHILTRLHWDGTDMKVVASDLAISRFTLRRRLKAFSDPWRVAA